MWGFNAETQWASSSSDLAPLAWLWSEAQASISPFSTTLKTSPGALWIEECHCYWPWRPRPWPKHPAWTNTRVPGQQFPTSSRMMTLGEEVCPAPDCKVSLHVQAPWSAQWFKWAGCDPKAAGLRHPGSFCPAQLAMTRGHFLRDYWDPSWRLSSVLDIDSSRTLGRK